MNDIRKAAVAGSFYSSDPVQLRASVEDLLSSAQVPKLSHQKALIVPHAGHIYSGEIAASIYAQFQADQQNITRVVLLGPSHHVGFNGIAAPSTTNFETPLGLIKIDQVAIESIMHLPFTEYLDQAHAREHSLEVHLPFLQCLFEDFSLVPLVVGNATHEQVADVIESLWGGPETLIVISSDLSHFHNYADAQLMDNNTAKKILNFDTDLTPEEACGCKPINGLLHVAKSKKLHIQQIDVRNSGDTAGDKARVVGYGAFTIAENLQQSGQDNSADQLSVAARQQIIQIARQAILFPFHNKQFLSLNLEDFSNELTRIGACFITLKINNQLRGCIGTLEAHRPLILDVANNAQAAAFKDPRFKPLGIDEFHHLELHASVLSPPKPMDVNSRAELLAQIRPGKDGLIIEEGGKRATYLPSVWDQLPKPEDFISELRKKAGLDPSQWHDCHVQTYTTEEFY